MGEMDQTRATTGSNESKEQDSYRHVSLLALPLCHCWRGTFFFENELAWYLADVNFTTTSLHHSPRITRARTRDGSTKTNPPFITATFVTCEIIIMTVCDYMNLSWMRLRNKNESSFHRHVYFELNGCVDGLAKRGQERPRAWNNMIN